MNVTPLREGIQRVLKYTEIRPSTAADFDKPDRVQAASSATIEGFYMLGLGGAVANAAATLVGLEAQDRFGKTAGALAGAAAGAALGALSGHLLGASSLALTSTLGGVCGAYSTLRGNEKARFRDAGAFGLTFGSPVLQGGAKAALGLASVLGAECEKESHRGLLGGALGAAAGVAFSLAGQSALSPLVAGLAGAGVGAFGAVAGPRIANAMRNASEDIGKKMVKPKESQNPEEAAQSKSPVQRIVGGLPLAVMRQGVMAFAMGRLDPTSVAIGFGLDTATSAYEVYLSTKQPPAA